MQNFWHKRCITRGGMKRCKWLWENVGIRRQQKSTAVCPFSKEKSTESISSNIGKCPTLGVKDIPGPWPSLPLIGTFWQYSPFGPYTLEKMHEANQDKYKKYGMICKEELKKGMPLINLFNPDDFEKVLRNIGKHPLRPGTEAVCHYRLSQPHKYKSVGLSNAQGDEWYELRNALTPILMKPKTIAAYLPQQNEVCLDFIRLLEYKLNPDTSIIEDFQTEIYKLAMESVLMLCLDSRIGCLDLSLKNDGEASKVILATQNMFQSFLLLSFGIPLWKIYKTQGYKLLEESETVMYSTVSKYIDKAIRKLKDTPVIDGIDRLSVLETLISAPNIHPLDVRMTIIDFITAGIDTVSNTLTYFFYQIGKNVEVQEKLYREINHVLPNKKAMTAESLHDLPYLKATVKEVFRINPTIPGLIRVTRSSHNLSGYEIPENTPVFMQWMVASMIPEYFPDPEKLCPERWMSNKKNNPFVVLPFGHGARMCVGRRFAEQEIYATIATVLQHYRVELAQETLGSIYRFIVVPDRKLRLKLIKRD